MSVVYVQIRTLTVFGLQKTFFYILSRFYIKNDFVPKNLKRDILGVFFVEMDFTGCSKNQELYADFNPKRHPPPPQKKKVKIKTLAQSNC